MKHSKILWLSVLFAFLFLFSCKKDEETETTPVSINESEVLATFLESPNSPLQKDYVNSDMPSIIGAPEVKQLNETGQIYVIDIRTESDFNSGHIHNAVNVSFPDLLSHIESVDLTPYTKVAIVCYTGQTAGYGACILRLMGYDKVYSMKWGMCSWHHDFAEKWNNAVANGNAYATQFTADVTEKGTKGNMPALSTGKTTGLDILKSRVATLLTDGFSAATISNTAVFDNLSNYYVVNYWPATDYADPGHIPGAMQYTPQSSIKLSADLKTLPTDKTVVVYCYTGQTSAFLTAYLRILGYDAKSLLYGANGMIYDKLVEMQLHAFGDSQIYDYDYDQ